MIVFSGMMADQSTVVNGETGVISSVGAGHLIGDWHRFQGRPFLAKLIELGIRGPTPLGLLTSTNSPKFPTPHVSATTLLCVTCLIE